MGRVELRLLRLASLGLGSDLMEVLMVLGVLVMGLVGMDPLYVMALPWYMYCTITLAHRRFKSCQGETCLIPPFKILD